MGAAGKRLASRPPFTSINASERPHRTCPAGWPGRPSRVRTPGPWSGDERCCNRRRGSTRPSIRIWSGCRRAQLRIFLAEDRVRDQGCSAGRPQWSASASSSGSATTKNPLRPAGSSDCTRNPRALGQNGKQEARAGTVCEAFEMYAIVEARRTRRDHDPREREFDTGARERQRVRRRGQRPSAK